MKIYLSAKISAAQIKKISYITTVYYCEDKDLYYVVETSQCDSMNDFYVHE